jgi:hypothetical protein
MRLPPLRLVLGLLVLALIVGTVLLAGPNNTDLPELSARSSAPNGARALRLWLEALGYRVEEIDEEPYSVPDGTAALLLLQPSADFDPAALDRLEAWVEDGGQLVLVAAGRGPRRLLERFGLSLEFTGERRGDAAVVQPLLLRPPVERVRLNAWDALGGDGRLAPWVAAGDRVYVGSFPFGRGRVVALSAPYPLSNAGLADANNAALALNLVGALPPGARVAFDEYHHGFVRRGARGLWSLLLEHYWGWAALYVVALGYLYLLWRGRRFGRPLAIDTAPRRTVGEYVASLAVLYRRAGQRGYAADMLAQQLKHELADGLGLHASLPDAAFAEAASQRRGTDPAPLARVLRRLREGPRLTESDLLALVRQGDDLARRLLRRNR